MSSGKPVSHWACVGILAVFASSVHAQEYPSRPIRMISSGVPGGLNDLSTRIIAQGMAINLGQQVFVENRPGAMGLIGYETASRSIPDGYTLFHGAGEMTMLPYQKKSAAKFDALRDLSPVALAVSTWGAFLTSPKFPVHSLSEFIAHAKANPGTIRYATNGVGGAQHLAVELLQMKTGIQLLHIPYKGTAQVATDTLSGQVEMASMALSSAVANRSRLNVLAQTGPTRIASLSDVPTTAELGLPDVRIDIWFGLMAPANTPAHIVERLAHALDATLKDRAVADKFFAMGCEITYLPPKAFIEYIAREKRKWSELFPVWKLPMED